MSERDEEGTVPRWMEVFGWYGSLAIVGAYAANSHGWMEEGVAYQLLNLSGAIGVGLVCWKRRAWQPLSLELVWAVIAVSALL